MADIQRHYLLRGVYWIPHQNKHDKNFQKPWDSLNQIYDSENNPFLVHHSEIENIPCEWLIGKNDQDLVYGIIVVMIEINR